MFPVMLHKLCRLVVQIFHALESFVKLYKWTAQVMQLVVQVSVGLGILSAMLHK